MAANVTSRSSARNHFSKMKTALGRAKEAKDPALQNELEQELIVEGISTLFFVLLHIGDGLHAIAKAGDRIADQGVATNTKSRK